VSTDPGRKRLCQWVKLEDRASGYKVLYLNTHLEVKSSGTSISEEEAVTIRTKSAELICNRIASLNADGNFAVILGGDMNSSTTESAHVDWFKSQLTDSYYRSADLGVKEGPVATYNAYSYDDEQRSKWYHRIDYLYFKGNMDVLKYKVIDDKYNGYFPSDHWPLMVDFTLK
jgi:endonuclease/exonuclease/phosphatase family metal-dependent hydrolase